MNGMMKSGVCMALALAAALLPAGCYDSSGNRLAGDAGADGPKPDLRQDVASDRVDVGQDWPPPDPVPPDTAPDAERQCVSDSDCVVVLHQNRCCAPDPMAVPRALAGSNPCWHVMGEKWVDSTSCPDIDCTRCMPISTRAYGARCADGFCVPVEDFCPSSMAEMPWPVAWIDARSELPSRWDDYRGRVVNVQGEAILGPDSCACCFDCFCDCFDNPVRQTLSCKASLAGSVCGRELACAGTECAPTCSPRAFAGRSSFTGYLVDSVEDGWELWVMASGDDCPPFGPNPEGASCTPFSEGDCADGLFCYYWGDVVSDCIGECRREGTECRVEGDCDEGETCYHGYCEWCCPG